MAKSMTGFGKGTCTRESQKVSVEIRSVNHRYLELSLRLPRYFNSCESALRRECAQQISRGKVEVRVNYEDYRSDRANVHFDASLAAAYAGSLKQLTEMIGEEDSRLLPIIARMPDVFQAEVNELSDELAWELLSEALTAALADYNRCCSVEGEALTKDLLQLLDELQTGCGRIAAEAAEIVPRYREKLLARLNEILEERLEEYYPGQRLAQELALFADKADVREELVRLESHTKQFRNTVTGSGAVGKKLDFLLQEMNREVNTIASKSTELALSNEAITMKSLIESLREQIQNLE